MSLPIGPILGILADNLRQRGSVLPLPKREYTRWARGLDLPRGGKTVLYTGHMYQLIPAIEAMSGQMAMFENSPITRFFGLGRMTNKVINMSFFMSLLASGERKREFDQVLRDIATLLKKAGVDFGYLYEKEFYSGALVYDQGMDEVIAEHAPKVYDMLKKNGVERVITVDPHTTNMLREVYPKFIKDYDLQVESYLSVLARAGLPVAQTLNKSCTMHDSCVYARYENLTDSPRTLLQQAGVELKEPELSGKNTHCCGGPIEALFPAEAHRIAKNRVEQLQAQSNQAVAMCPICLVNLCKAAAGSELKIQDIAGVLAEACKD